MATAQEKALKIRMLIQYAEMLGALVLLSVGIGMWSKYDYVMIPLENTQMSPAFKPQDSYLGRRIADYDQIAYGDVVYYQYPMRVLSEGPEHLMFARVAGLPGDRISFKKGILHRNGEAIREDVPAECLSKEDRPETLVPRGHFYLLVDNRGTARLLYFNDSRFLGPILREAVIGKLEK